MQKFLWFSFFICSTVLFCIWLSPKHILRESMNNHKKQGITTMILFVSLPFYEH